MLVDNAKGGFSFVKGIGPFSSGAVATHGFEIVHATVTPMVRLGDGFDLVERHLRGAGRPMNALCGMELRIPKPLSPKGFDQFNRGYLERLAAWKVHLDGMNPAARTNVAIEVNPVPEPSLYGFYYTVPSNQDRARTFVLAGAGEVRSTKDDAWDIVAGSDVSAKGLREKAAFIVEQLELRMREMNVSWADASAVNLYTVHDVHPILASMLLPAIAPAGRRGIIWHFSRPPVIAMEMEIDAHAAREIIVTA